MNDIYRKPLLSDDYILLYLRQFISEISVCKKIIFIKKQKEKNEIYNYHVDRWENIIGDYYYLIDNHYKKFSYILNEKHYIIKKDYKNDFFEKTGISYQVIDLLFKLIRIRCDDRYNCKTNDDYTEWLKYDDDLYGKLSEKIMIEMKKEIVKI